MQLRFLSSRNLHFAAYIFSLLFLITLSGCLTSQKMDVYVAERYGNQLPKPARKKSDIAIQSELSTGDKKISHTVKKTSHLLPLIVYWQCDYRHTCTLNSDIALTTIANNINAQSAKINQKLNGQHLELTIENVPTAFSIVDKEHLFLMILWAHVYVEPENKDLVVSYKLFKDEAVAKTGTITINNPAHNRNVRFFQSWKSSSSEFLSSYDADLAAMTKDLVKKLTDEL